MISVIISLFISQIVYFTFLSAFEYLVLVLKYVKNRLQNLDLLYLNSADQQM